MLLNFKTTFLVMNKQFLLKKLAAIFMLILPLTFTVSAQSSFLPANLGSNVNTTYAEVNPVLSFDGKTLFFNRLNHPENYYGIHDSQDIWYSTLQADGTWGMAKRLDVPFNKARHNAIICALTKDNYLIDGVYTNSKNPKWLKRGFSVVTRNDNEQWTAPQKLKVKGYTRLNEGKEVNAWMTSDKQAMILSYSHHYNGKKNNLYVSLFKKGKWSKPKKLNKTINAVHTNEEAPFVAENNETMYFSSNRAAKTKKERKYNYHIFKSNRLDDTWRNWSTPVMLSDTINSEIWDSYFRTNPKGSWAYFTTVKNSIGEADIFKVKLFEENPFVVVKGKIINKSKNTPLEKTKNYTVFANGNTIDSIVINKDSSTYWVKLPLRNAYSIAASVKNYISTSELVDVMNVREYTEIYKDLYVEPIPYVAVSGHLLTYAPRGIVAEATNPKIAINGKIIDSIKIKYPEGSYEVLLPYGKNYELTAKVGKLSPIPTKIELAGVTEYQEIKQDLFVKKTPIAVVSGFFYVKGTTSPISSKYLPKLTINGEIVDSAQIDTAKSSYKIYLPLGKTYQLSMAATKYQGIASSVDVSKTTEQTDITRNIYGTYVSSSAIVKGKIINRKTNLPLTGAQGLTIQENGANSPTGRYYPNSGEYELEIGLGTSHTINGSAAKYLPQYELIDLSKQKGNVTIMKDLYMTPIEVGQNVKMNNIFFETGKATLKPKSFTELDKVAKFLTENDHVKIQIQGHTDNVGKADANLKLSKWRARAVQQYLVKKGINVNRVNFEGFGSTKPVAKNTTAIGKSMNRRVEFSILAID